MGINIDEINQTKIIPIAIKMALTLFYGYYLFPTFPPYC